MSSLVIYTYSRCQLPVRTGAQTGVKMDGHGNARPYKTGVIYEIPPKPSKAAVRHFRLFSPYNFRPDVDNDVMSGMAIDNIGMNVCVKFGQTVFEILDELISC